MRGHVGPRADDGVPVDLMSIVRDNPRVPRRRLMLDSEGRRTPTYQSYRSMLERCSRPRHPSWHRYGGRGIIVCDRWNPTRGGGFANFLADMGERPAGLTLDRIDNDGNYEPGNCRWATPKAQQRDHPRKSHCVNGHPLVGENVYLRPDNGKRQCRACGRARRLRRRQSVGS